MIRDLIEAAQRGNQGAFVDLVHTHGDRLFRVAHRILRDIDRAEDALQYALVIAWCDLPSLRDSDPFDGWATPLFGGAPGPEGATDVFVSVRG